MYDYVWAIPTQAEHALRRDVSQDVLELLETAANGVKLGLLDCKDSALQAFSFDAASGELKPRTDTELCLIVAASSRSAGPFMSRDLQLGECAQTDTKFKRWVIKTGG
ncbi:MAG: hypothetical protein HRU27_05115 [Rhizobiaceae bacterium]|nr:hypothetical protein [Rhizobiaceae bacterium]